MKPEKAGRVPGRARPIAEHLDRHGQMEQPRRKS
jgi:hypothetical protein